MPLGNHVLILHVDRVSQIAQPPVFAALFKRREPSARKIQDSDDAHPHQVDKYFTWLPGAGDNDDAVVHFVFGTERPK
jgi:hypothetical protein